MAACRRRGVEDGVSRARAEALKSAEQFRLGAALLRRHAVVSCGRNRNINACGLASIHAEMDALSRTPKNENFRDLHLVVVRLLRDGDTTACSKPCEACARAIARRGIRRVTYTTGDPGSPLATLHLFKARTA